MAPLLKIADIVCVANKLIMICQAKDKAKRFQCKKQLI